MDANYGDATFDLPPPRELADSLMARAWDDDTDDDSRPLLEHGSLMIKQLLARLAVATEHGEARRAAR